MQIRVNASTATSLVTAAGHTLDELKKKGRIDLSGQAYIIAQCDPAAKRRCFTFALIEVSHSGGAALAEMVNPADRQLLPACHMDSDGTFDQRRKAEAETLDEQTKQERFRQAFLAM